MNTKPWLTSYSGTLSTLILLGTVNDKPVTTIADGVFMNHTELNHVIIPSSFQTIGVNAFKGCGLTTVCIPSSVHFIGANAFKDCNVSIYELTHCTPIFDASTFESTRPVTVWVNPQTRIPTSKNVTYVVMPFTRNFICSYSMQHDRLQRHLYQLLIQHRERRRHYKFYNFLPIIFEVVPDMHEVCVPTFFRRLDKI